MANALYLLLFGLCTIPIFAGVYTDHRRQQRQLRRKQLAAVAVESSRHTFDDIVRVIGGGSAFGEESR